MVVSAFIIRSLFNIGIVWRWCFSKEPTSFNPSLKLIYSMTYMMSTRNFRSDIKIIFWPNQPFEDAAGGEADKPLRWGLVLNPRHI
jgi:hypothetical protein